MLLFHQLEQNHVFIREWTQLARLVETDLRQSNWAKCKQVYIIGCTQSLNHLLIVGSLSFDKTYPDVLTLSLLTASSYLQRSRYLSVTHVNALMHLKASRHHHDTHTRQVKDNVQASRPLSGVIV